MVFEVKFIKYVIQIKDFLNTFTYTPQYFKQTSKGL